MSVQLECIGCRKIKEFPEIVKYPVCPVCKEWEIKHREDEINYLAEQRTCVLCGYTGIAIDNHHIHGRKISDETIKVCANCHREIHAGIRQL